MRGKERGGGRITRLPPSLSSTPTSKKPQKPILDKIANLEFIILFNYNLLTQFYHQFRNYFFFFTVNRNSFRLNFKISFWNFGGKFLVGTFLWEKFGWSPTLLWVFPSSSPSHSFSSSSSLSFLPPLRICYNCNGQLNGNMKIELARILNKFSIWN